MPPDEQQQIDADIPDWGPKMRALRTDKMRNFVVALYDEKAPLKGDGLLIFAAAQAKYGTPKSTNKILSVIANRLMNNPDVQAAIAEYSRGMVRAIAPEAVRAVRQAVRNRKHKDHIRAAAMIVDRTDPIETTHNVKIEDARPATPEMTDKVLARIEQLMQRAGLLKSAPVIEGECVVIAENASG